MKRDAPPHAGLPGAAVPSFDVLDALYVNARGGLLAQWVGAVILVLAYFRGAAFWACAAWSIGWLISCSARWWAMRLYRLRVPGDAVDTRRACIAWDASNLLVGAVWGLAALLFYDRGDVPQQIGLTVLVCTLCVVLPASRYGVYLATLALGFGPLIVDVVLDSRPHGLALAAVLGLLYLLAAWLASSYRRAFGQLFGLMRRAEALAGLLAEEKQRADAARRQAEEVTANRSRFFVAASHDLRQPLQALLLFADALKHQSLPTETLQLVDQVGASARSLEALFDDLLDMSQLEAGGVQARLRPVLLDSVYRSVVLHCRPLAFDRGLALDLRGGQRCVQADPALLERMLRNLVTNAINHTADGGVLVTCRPRGADHWRLQVWDTGCGIPEPALLRVFDQFYRGPEPRGRGLGLGLTIAQAFAGLMGTQLQVRSVAGRGTVFSFTLQRAHGAAAVASADGVVVRSLVSLTGCSYVVVSAGLPEADQVAELLRLWRATVHQVDDVAALAAWARARGAQGGVAPQGLVLGQSTLAEQQVALQGWLQTWPGVPAAAVLMAPAGYPAADWQVLVRLSQPLAAHRLRACVVALGSRGAARDRH